MHATNEALALAWLYLDRPRRTERVLRGLGHVLVVVYVLWDVVTFGAWVFGEYLYAPAVLTPPVLGPPVAVAAFYLLPAPAVGVTVRVRRLEACLVASPDRTPLSVAGTEGHNTLPHHYRITNELRGSGPE